MNVDIPRSDSTKSERIKPASLQCAATLGKRGARSCAAGCSALEAAASGVLLGKFGLSDESVLSRDGPRPQ